MAYENLRDLIEPGKLDDRFGDVATAKDSRFDLQTPSEPQVLFYRLTFFDWQLRQFGSPVHEERGAIGMELVCYAASSTDEHCG